jgi:hypothetical protein
MNQKPLSNNNHLISAPAVSLRLIVQIQWQALGLCLPFLPSSLTTAHPVQEGMWRSCGTAAAAFKTFHIIYQILVFGQQGTVSYQTESRNETKRETLMLTPAFALVSMKVAPCSVALASPSSVDTFLVTYNR